MILLVQLHSCYSQPPVFADTYSEPAYEYRKIVGPKFLNKILLFSVIFLSFVTKKGKMHHRFSKKRKDFKAFLVVPSLVSHFKLAIKYVSC